MQKHPSSDILENYMKWWQAHTHQLGQIHGQFLELRQAGLQQVAGSIEKQLDSSRPGKAAQARALFSLEDLNEFAAGSVVKCLGQEYAVYAGRRSPRIPNGEFLLMSRILSIRGRKGEFEQASAIVAEYDVPADAWYLDGEAPGQLPYSICIEIALQPCGMLSAYLGTPLRNPEFDYYFRNLDGETMFHRQLDARGRTVQVRAELLKTVFYGAIIIQHFAFALSCDGEVFFDGSSSFGYFSAEALAGQAGLDAGKKVLPWLVKAGPENKNIPVDPAILEESLPKGKLHLLDTLVIDRAGGAHQQGYAYANRRNNPGDWFYACHFHEDPVMPGSLGIEAILQAMRVFVRQQSNRAAPARLATGQKMNWTYRGQVLQSHRQMQVEVHFQKVQQVGKTRQYRADASLWADDTRIYEVHNMVVAIEEE
jgi:3-hydroxymyristoyl/3-hydroxydecanoyl-(acyl carrier protein) dehydratase